MEHTSTADLLERALLLPVEDRLALATEILKSVEGPEDPEWAEAWLRELDRRAAAAGRGEEPLEDWETVEARILADLHGK